MDQNISKYFRIFSTERQAASKLDQLDLDRIFLTGTKTARWSRETWKDDSLRTKFLSLLLLFFVVVGRSCSSSSSSSSSSICRSSSNFC